MHTNRTIAVLTLMAIASLSAAADEPYTKRVRPLIEQYCLACHSTEKKRGELDLERFADVDDIRKDLETWRKVIEMLENGEMPPQKKPQPNEEARAQLIDWTRAFLDAEARARAGDPGLVVLRRLSNAQYNYTVRDLTGIDLQPALEFPIDGAAGEGFTNTGDGLVMSPALLEKYFHAAKKIARHAMLLPEGIRFSRHTTRRDRTDEVLEKIRTLYRRFTVDDPIENVQIPRPDNGAGRAPLEAYLRATLRERERRQRDASSELAEVAAEMGLSAKYLRSLWSFFSDETSGNKILLNDLRALWRSLSPREAGKLAEEIKRRQQPLWIFNPVGTFNRWLEPRAHSTSRQTVKTTIRPEDEDVVLRLVALDAGDGNKGDLVVWKRPRFEAKGRETILLRDIPVLSRAFDTLIRDMFADTERYLEAAADLATRNLSESNATPESLAKKFGVDTATLKRWTTYLGVDLRTKPISKLLKKTMVSVGAKDVTPDLTGWGKWDKTFLVANSGDRTWDIPGFVPPHSIVVRPSETDFIGIGWLSPVDIRAHIEALVADTHTTCGNGIAWTLQLRRARLRRILASGTLQNEKRTIGPFENITLRQGDVLSLLVGARDREQRCDLTHVDLTIQEVDGEERKWNLAREVSGTVRDGNPHADSFGNHGVWHFYTGDGDSVQHARVVVPGSALARWLESVGDPSRQDELRTAASDLAKLLESGPLPQANHPDAVLYRALTALDGPFLNDVHLADLARKTAESESPKSSVEPPPGNLFDWSTFGRHPAGVPLDNASFVMHAPRVLEVHVPRALVSGREFISECELDMTTEIEGSVQVQVSTESPTSVEGLVAELPVLTRGQRKNDFDKAFEAFRERFPPAMCYTQIVPIDEPVTFVLFHRDDDTLRRLMLGNEDTRELDRLWRQLHSISQDALTLKSAFGEWWEYGANKKKFSRELLERPIIQRAQRFREELRNSESGHLDDVLDFAERAYRRPLSVDEKIELLELYRTFRAQNQPHDDSVLGLLTRVLVSSSFLYRVEHSGPGPDPQPVSSWELASRLSYLLWSSMPDDELRRAAESGSILSSEGLVEQALRMLDDKRVRALAIEFAAQWLGIRDFERHDGTDLQRFPTFAALRPSMYEECIRFFEDIFRGDRPVIDILDADDTFLDPTLADHYGIPGITAAGWQRVEGTKKYNRGGVLGMAALLTKHSGASRTSPVLRGNWVLETLLGGHLPKPPPNVPQLPDDETDTAGLTVRQLVEAHREVAECAICHEKIDPLGFALEGFDPIGRRRDKDLAGRPIDTRVRLNGDRFADLGGLRHYLLTVRKDEFLRNFCRKLLGYALGRSVELSDEALLATMLEDLEKNGYRFSSTIVNIVVSRQFRYHRGDDARRSSDR